MVQAPTRFVSTRNLITWGSAMVGLGLVAVIDWFTGPDLSVSVFYMLPIAWVAWQVSGRVGQLFAVLGAGIWMAIDMLSQPPNQELALTLWNTLVRLSFFVVVVALLDRTRKLTAQAGTVAFIDALTGLVNSRGFRDRVTLELNRQRRSGEAMTIAYVDLDHFKRVNDEHGHDQGDHVLRVVAETMSRSLRSTDLVARIGADEFALLLPNTDEHGARHVLELLRARVLEVTTAGGWSISASIGAVSFARGPAQPDEALERADALMHTVKRTSRNGVACVRVQFD